MSNPSPVGPPGPFESIDPEYAAESNTGRIVAVVTVFHAIALATVVARIWARVWLVRSPGWDDWVMILAAVSQDARSRRQIRGDDKLIEEKHSFAPWEVGSSSSSKPITGWVNIRIQSFPPTIRSFNMPDSGSLSSRRMGL